MPDHNYFSTLVCQTADVLRGSYRPPQYERVIPTMTVLHLFDYVLTPAKNKVVKEYELRKDGKLNDEPLDKLPNKKAGQRFHNYSHLDFQKLKGDPDHIETHLLSYLKGFTAVDWKNQQKEIQAEQEKQGNNGPFGARLPRVNDGSLLFLQHMISKLEPVRPAEHKHGSRLAIVLSGSPLFLGGEGSSESDIRKWIIENARAPRIRFSDFGQMFLPRPDSNKQRTIVGHIAKETDKLDALHSVTKKTILLFKERCRALIAAAVTGQIDVEAAA